MDNQAEADERRSITIKIRLSPREKAVIEKNARISNRSVSAFMRERSMGLHTSERVSRIICADLRRTAISLHRLAEAAREEQVESMVQLLARTRGQVMKLLDRLNEEQADVKSEAGRD